MFLSYNYGYMKKPEVKPESKDLFGCVNTKIGDKYCEQALKLFGVVREMQEESPESGICIINLGEERCTINADKTFQFSYYIRNWPPAFLSEYKTNDAGYFLYMLQHDFTNMEDSRQEKYKKIMNILELASQRHDLEITGKYIDE
jgi:hypothetical protein